MTSHLYDDHLHSVHSCDATAPVPVLCAAARAKGLAGLTVTDHLDTDPRDSGYCFYNYDALARACSEARDAGPGSDLCILLGAEVDYQTPFHQRAADFLRACPLDLALGGAHYGQREYIDEAYFSRRAIRAAYDAYLGTVEDIVASGLFDALAHLDVAKRYGIRARAAFVVDEHWPRLERILLGVIQQGMALEVNASGYRQAPGEPYPGEAILRRYYELGGRRLTFGSDAHRPESVGAGIAEAQALARRLGFTQGTRYVQRRPVSYPL
ncbi:MAG: histidinol-phosphatase HisJ family protein [Anaerolineae bacterium]